LLVARWRPPHTAACHVRRPLVRRQRLQTRRYGRRRYYYYGRATPLLRLLLVLLYGQFGD